MNPRQPPRLANWLLHFFGYARQNPPLAGDMQEEFQWGRSAAWYWRQTLVLSFTCLARNARNSRRRLTGGILGWAIQVGISSVLWRLHFPPRMPHGRSVSGQLLILSAFLTLVLMVGLAVLLKWGYRELKRRSSDPEGRLMSACDQFGNSLWCYSFNMLLGGEQNWSFVSLQAMLLSYWMIFNLIPAVVFARRTKS
jgi:hypothetical protein